MLNAPVYDLHADLLCYLAGDSSRTANDLCVRCALPQLVAGNVKLQVLPVFVETAKNSSQSGMKQAAVFASLPKQYPEQFKLFEGDFKSRKGIQIKLALENGSSFSEETEPLEQSLIRLETFFLPHKLLYISLTWNEENRFGGGAFTNVGLKPDGRVLLDYLHEKKVAVDLSHASDSLAFDILQYIDSRKLDIRVMASHSNMRAVADVPRNLPDELVLEIYRRKGIIGFNFVRYFVGVFSTDPVFFAKQLEHALKLGGEHFIGFGADFFYGNDVPLQYRRPPEEIFFPGFDNSSIYGKVMQIWQQELGIGSELQEKIAFRNFENYLKDNVGNKKYEIKI